MSKGLNSIPQYALYIRITPIHFAVTDICTVSELDRLFSSLYEDKVMERITGWNFEMISGRYQKKQLEIEAWLREVTKTLNETSVLGISEPVF